MDKVLSLLAIIMTAIAMGLSLAHALEFPGKLRLDEATYRAVQAIYYPGFTMGGLIGEVGALIVLPVLLFLLPLGSERFWWTSIAFASLVITHSIYWFVTHPVNNVWLNQTDVSGLGTTFFSTFAGQDSDWRNLRSIWEYSHVARACFAMLGLIAISVSFIW